MLLYQLHPSSSVYCKLGEPGGEPAVSGSSDKEQVVQ